MVRCHFREKLSSKLTSIPTLGSDDQGQISLCPTQISFGPPDVLTHSVLYPHHCLSYIPITLARRERETSKFSNLFLASTQGPQGRSCHSNQGELQPVTLL